MFLFSPSLLWQGKPCPKQIWRASAMSVFFFSRDAIMKGTGNPRNDGQQTISLVRNQGLFGQHM